MYFDLCLLEPVILGTFRHFYVWFNVKTIISWYYVWIFCINMMWSFFPIISEFVGSIILLLYVLSTTMSQHNTLEVCTLSYLCLHFMWLALFSLFGYVGSHSTAISTLFLNCSSWRLFWEVRKQKRSMSLAAT